MNDLKESMTVFLCRAKEDGGLDMSEYQRATFRQEVKDSAPHRMRMVLQKEVPESNKQRAFYHGAILPLWAYYDGKDYKSSTVLNDLHEVAKVEFNPQIVIVDGKEHKIGKSTKGKLQDGYLERIIDYLVENYAIDPLKELNPDTYKIWRDTIYPYSTKYDDFISYLLDLGLIHRITN